MSIKIDQSEFDKLNSLCNEKYYREGQREEITKMVAFLVNKSSLPEKKKAYISSNNFEVTSWKGTDSLIDSLITVRYINDWLSLEFVPKR